ncbi:hypothetical protein IT575_14645 [bacterium]|nr:hypothetical protein [bacterium]
MICLGLLALGCGGGGLGFGSAERQRIPDWPGHSFEGAQSSGSFSLVAVDSGDESRIDSRSTSALRLDVQSRGSGRYRVDIYGQGLPASDRAFLHLKYDSSSTHPVASVLEPALRENTVFLGLSDFPGIVALGLVGMRGEKTLSGDALLASVEFEAGPPQAVRRASTVTGGLVKDLRFDTTNTDTLVWSLANSGDYNQNGQVSITDLTQIGIYFQARNTDSNWNEARVADGDENGIIAVQDLTPIGLNFLRRCDGYSVQTGSSESGPFSPIGSAPIGDAVAPGGLGFKVFNYQVGAPVNGAWYVVAAVDEQASQTATGFSNAVQYASANFPAPQNLSASSDGSKITLSWQAPVGSVPDGYHAFVSDSAAMAGAQQMNVGPITQLTFDCPLAVGIDSVHFFGVKAVYGAELSGFSNVFNYSPIGAPPQNLSAAKNGAVVSLSWAAPASGTPEGYNAYVDDANADMSAALKINLGPITNLNFDCPLAVSPDSSHYFAVKAIFNGEETGYSNIYFYEPGNPNDSDPPAWDVPGQEGIKLATPGDTVVDIEWYTASDIGSPPVSYQIFYAPSASGINWAGAPQDSGAAGTTTKQISGLSNGVSYDFGVRAVDNSGNATTNTNFLSATPVGGGVPVDSGVWQTPELVDDGGQVSTQQVGWLPDVAIDSSGVIHISHYNNSSQDLLYTYGNSGSWTTVTIDSEGDTGLWSDIEINPVTDLPMIAYHNAGAASLCFASYDGSTWNVETVDSGGDLGAFASLAFDPADDNPAIAYWNTIGQDVKYAKWNGSAWQKTTAWNGTTGYQLNGAYTSLGFSPTTGDPAISFCKNASEFDFQLWLAQNDGTGWDSGPISLGPSSDLGIYTVGMNSCLAFSPSGAIYVTHVELLGDVFITENSTGEWVDSDIGDTDFLSNADKIETSIVWSNSNPHWLYYDSGGGSVYYGAGLANGAVLDGAGSGAYPCIEADANGDLHGVWLDVSDNVLRYGFKDGNADWVLETAYDGNATGTGTVGDRASLQFHPGNFSPMISYYDVSNSGLKFARDTGSGWENETVVNNFSDGSASGMVVSPNGTANIAYFSVSSQSYGLYVAQGTLGNWDYLTIQEGDFSQTTDVVGNYCSIGIGGGPTYQLGVSYYNASQHRLEMALDDGSGGWEQTPVDIFNDAGRWTSTAFNPANKLPGVAYWARDTQDLYFAERAGNGIWTPQAVDTGANVGQHCSLVYGANTAKPWISYYDLSNKQLKLRYLDNDLIWRSVDIPAPAGSTNYGDWSSMAWHPAHQRAAVAFYDTTNGKLWYVFIGDPAAPQAAVEVAGSELVKSGAHCNLRFNAGTNQPSIAYQDVTNGDLYYVRRAPN